MELVTFEFDATDDLRLDVGQEVRAGQCLCQDAEGNNRLISPVTGIVRDVQFNPGEHTFTITIAPAPG